MTGIVKKLFLVMEIDQFDQNSQYGQPSAVLPPHSSKMVWAILCTLFCCLVGGVVAIVYSAESNSLYNSSLLSMNEQTRQNLYYESERKNKTAQTWIIISLVWGCLYLILAAVLWSMGILAGLLSFI